MNTLTKNRILQEGDEYRHNGTWKPVPEEDYGLQIQFTKYAEVRRPSEKPISPDRGNATPAKAESDNAPAPSHSGVGDTLPTVVSKKAHKRDDGDGSAEVVRKTAAVGRVPISRETPETVRPTEVPERVASPTRSLKVTWPDSAPPCIWTGRNGTFNTRGVNLHRGMNLIRIVPVGKRGEAKNALIEFPTSSIPEIIDWLLRQQK